MSDSDQYRNRRIAWLLGIALVAEAAMFVLAKRAPALGGLIRTGYYVVAGLFALAIWRAAKHRSGDDRRQGDRRHTAEMQ